MKYPTFKSFIGSNEVRNKAAIVASQLLGDVTVKERDDVDFAEVTGAKETRHKFIDTKHGAWVAVALKKKGKSFVRVTPPKGSEDPTLYFFEVESEEE